MFQSAELRLAALAFSTGLAVWLASSPSRAFSREISGAVESAIRRSPTRATRSRISGAAHVRSAPMAPSCSSALSEAR